jgi:hypothetical protein
VAEKGNETLDLNTKEKFISHQQLMDSQKAIRSTVLVWKTIAYLG